jgi:hypothetical protein
VLDSTSVDLNNIPANSFFALGGVATDLKTRPVDIDVVWTVTDDFGPKPKFTWETTTAPLPRQRGQYLNVSVTTETFGTGASPEFPAYNIVLLDSAGRIVGGANEYANAPITPGQTSRDAIEVFLPRSAESALAYLDPGLL